MPSIFGINNLKFTIKHDIMIENQDNYFNIIKREIEDRLVGKSSEKRAVLVVFELTTKIKIILQLNSIRFIKRISCLSNRRRISRRKRISN
jgi:hypothetical protein